MKKTVAISILVVGIFLAAVLCLLLGVSNTKARVADEQQIRELVQRISIGASPEEVRTIFKSFGSPRLELKEIDPNEWLVTTPMRFGAINWDLWILFSEGKAQSLRVRLADSKAMHPSNGPPDKR